jgi:hypothetical protein
MPLSPGAAREPIHHRQIDCRGFRRADGLWDIEGHIVDTKSYGFPNRARGRIEAGEPIHEMWIRLTIDESMTIHAVEAVTDAGPFTICPDITPAFQQLKGLKIDGGWRKAVAQRLGREQGCTHLVELLGPVATTAFQTLVAARRASEAADPNRRPRFLDTCHALKSDGPVVQEQWPQFYRVD